MQRNAQTANAAERRIMSLNQINHNIPTGASAFSPNPSLLSTGASLLPKRSHSVKTQFVRKPSWAGKRHVSVAEQDKENQALSEVSEDELQRPDSRDMVDSEDFASQTGTERRASNMSRANSRLTYTDAPDSIPDSVLNDRDSRISGAPSEYSYMTGSYLTGSEIDHRTSLGSSADGIFGATSIIDEDPNEEFHELDGDDQAVAGAIQEAEEREQELLQLEPPPTIKDLQIYAPASDSGLGTDAPPTAAARSSIGTEYFKQ